MVTVVLSAFNYYESMRNYINLFLAVKVSFIGLKETELGRLLCSCSPPEAKYSWWLKQPVGELSWESGLLGSTLVLRGKSRCLPAVFF